MGKKIYVSYKYKDQSVFSLRGDSIQEILNPTTARDYVDKLETLAKVMWSITLRVFYGAPALIVLAIIVYQIATKYFLN